VGLTPLGIVPTLRFAGVAGVALYGSRTWGIVAGLVILLNPSGVHHLTSGFMRRSARWLSNTVPISYCRPTAPPMARAGLQQFMSRGCAACHNGVGIGGQLFQKIGVVEECWKVTGSQEIDQGRIGLTKDPADLYVFKVRSLRKVAMTPPYFHDGSVATLDEAVQVMHACSWAVRSRTTRAMRLWRFCAV
jgi:hypothetical protein